MQDDAMIGPRVLVIDGDAAFAETIAEGLEKRGFNPLPLASSREAAWHLEHEPVDALLTALRMPSLDGIDLLCISKRISPWRPVILMAEYSAIEIAIAGIRQGAYHYLIKPFMLEELALFLERALKETKAHGLERPLQHGPSEPIPTLVGSSLAICRLRELIDRVAGATASVLVSGETGTGKGLVARTIHNSGPRRTAPFVTLNCAAAADAPLEHELFGGDRDAAGGALLRRGGALERANGGTLLLDEIAEATLPQQAKLLQLLESSLPDVRVIATTRTGLSERVKGGAFREDLAYRLGVINVDLTPLRYRSEDVPELTEHFVALAKHRHPQSLVERCSPGAMARLREHDWPGNVRELEHCVEQVVLVTPGLEVGTEQLPPAVVAPRTTPATFHGEVVPLRELGRLYARWAYERSGGRKMLAAERLQIDYKTLSKMLLGDADGSLEFSKGTG